MRLYMYNIDHNIVLMIWLHSYATKFNDQTIILLCLPCVRALSRYLGTNDKVQIVVPSTIYTLSFSDRQMRTIILLQKLSLQVLVAHAPSEMIGLVIGEPAQSPGL